jgi:hypothetical protein
MYKYQLPLLLRLPFNYGFNGMEVRVADHPGRANYWMHGARYGETVAGMKVTILFLYFIHNITILISLTEINSAMLSTKK